MFYTFEDVYHKSGIADSNLSVISTTIKWIIHFFKQVSLKKVTILNTTIRGP